MAKDNFHQLPNTVLTESCDECFQVNKLPGACTGLQQMGHMTHTYPKPDNISNWESLTNEELVFSKGVSLGKQAPLKCRPHAQQ